jgi:methionyl-tRNA synthetase
MITYDQFKGTELKVGTVKAAERLAGSDKLLKLQVDFGTEERQIIAGIGKTYEPENLVGLQLSFVTNLEPRPLLGEVSNGMILAAHDADGRPVILIPHSPVPPGSSIS